MLDPRYAAALSLLALLPMGLYVMRVGQAIVALSAVSVALIAASLYLMFGPAAPGDREAHS